MKKGLLATFIATAFTSVLAQGAVEMKSEEAKTWMFYSAIVEADPALASEMMAFNAVYIEECGKRLSPSEVKAHSKFPELQFSLAKKKPLPSDFKKTLCTETGERRTVQDDRAPHEPGNPW